MSMSRVDVRVLLALFLLLAAVLLLWLQASLIAALAALFAVTMAWLLLSQRLLVVLAAGLHAISSMRTPLLALASARMRDAIPKMTPALAALILALATIVGVSSMISSFRDSVIDWLQITLSAPVYLSNDGQTMPPALLQQIESMPLVEDTGWLHALPAQSGDNSMQMILLDLPRQGQDSYRMLSGVSLWLREQNDAERMATTVAAQAIPVMAGETLARRQQLQVGQSLELEVAGQERMVNIVGIFQDYSAGGGRFIAKRTHWPDAPQLPTSLAVYLPAAEVEPFRDWLHRRLDPTSSVRMISAERVKSETLRIFDQTFLLTRALRWILALVAMVGVSGALLALQLERVQELRLLHQLGLSGGEQQRLILFEALFLALLAMLLALPLGYLLGWLLTEIINLRAFGWHIDLTVLASHWLLMIGVGLLAGLLAAGIAMMVNQRRLLGQYAASSTQMVPT
jgi:putative ABC transport system permease protein